MPHQINEEEKKQLALLSKEAATMLRVISTFISYNGSLSRSDFDSKYRDDITKVLIKIDSI